MSMTQNYSPAVANMGKWLFPMGLKKSGSSNKCHFSQVHSGVVFRFVISISCNSEPLPPQHTSQYKQYLN